MALAILGLIAAAFLGSLATTAQATFIADQRATAESLARSQMEYVKSQPYATSYPSASIPSWLEDEGYSATIGVESLPADPNDPNGGTLDGIQKITVTIKRGTKSVLAVDGYKVDRYEAE